MSEEENKSRISCDGCGCIIIIILIMLFAGGHFVVRCGDKEFRMEYVNSKTE